MSWWRSGCAIRALRHSQLLQQLDPSLIRQVPSSTPWRQQPFSTTVHTKNASESAYSLDLSKTSSEPARIIPASPSYFTGTPVFTDYEIKIQALHSKYIDLPTAPPAEVPRVAWLRKEQFLLDVSEDISLSRYSRALNTMKKLNKIRQDVMPQDLRDMLGRFSRPRNLYQWELAPKVPDENGRGRGMGRRKTASATAYLVEGDGQVMINGKNIVQAFSRIHDRESALWSLKATNRLNKYNVFVVVRGGGLTGQAESTALAVAKALLVHEPALKSVLRRAGVIRTDPRQVERKKPGKLKSRKMPAWVKR